MRPGEHVPDPSVSDMGGSPAGSVPSGIEVVFPRPEFSTTLYHPGGCIKEIGDDHRRKIRVNG